MVQYLPSSTSSCISPIPLLTTLGLVIESSPLQSTLSVEAQKWTITFMLCIMMYSFAASSTRRGQTFPLTASANSACMWTDQRSTTAFYLVGLNNRAQHNAVFPQCPVFFREPWHFSSVLCHFPRALWFYQAFNSVILSLKLLKMSKWGGTIFWHHVVIRIRYGCHPAISVKFYD